MSVKKQRSMVHSGLGTFFSQWGICQFPRGQFEVSSRRTNAGTGVHAVRGTQNGDWQHSKVSAALVWERKRH